MGETAEGEGLPVDEDVCVQCDGCHDHQGGSHGGPDLQL